MTMLCDDVVPWLEAQGVEVFTVPGPRRWWSAEDKAHRGRELVSRLDGMRLGAPT